MAELKLIQGQSNAERKTAVLRELKNAADAILRGEISPDCFLLLYMDTRADPPKFDYENYNASYIEISYMTDVLKYSNMMAAWPEEE